MKGKTKAKTGDKEYGSSRYFLLTMLLSLIGWAFETGITWINTGDFPDRGFMTMPFCPIYGGSIIAAYFLLGTPDEGRGLLKNVESRPLRYGLYLLVAFILPSLAELIVGAVFDKALHTTLWDYSGLPLNINGYVCLPVSLAWAGLLFFFMKYAFMPLKKLVSRLPKTPTRVLAAFLLVAVVIDVAFNFAQVL